MNSVYKFSENQALNEDKKNIQFQIIYTQSKKT